MSPEQLLELTMIRERLCELVQVRYAVGLCPAERDEYERLADREAAILADRRAPPG